MLLCLPVISIVPPITSKPCGMEDRSKEMREQHCCGKTRMEGLRLSEMGRIFVKCVGYSRRESTLLRCVVDEHSIHGEEGGGRGLSSTERRVHSSYQLCCHRKRTLPQYVHYFLVLYRCFPCEAEFRISPPPGHPLPFCLLFCVCLRLAFLFQKSTQRTVSSS